MEIDQFERLVTLKKVRDRAQTVCNPLEFALRNYDLLIAIADHLCYPLENLSDEDYQKLGVVKPGDKD